MGTGAAGRVGLLFVLAMLASAVARAGAVGRLAGDFAVNGTGAATYNIPINVAAGMNGLKPAISLAYNSAAGDGLAGVGWSLSGLSEISRCGLTPAVDGRFQGVRYSREDRFCLDGQPLVLVRGSYGADQAEYRTEVHSYQKIMSYGVQGTGPQYFEVLHPNGLIYRYGNDADSRIEVADGSHEVRIWAVNEIDDKYYQRISFAYFNDSANGEYFPLEIRWTYAYDQGINAARYRLSFSYQPRPLADVHGGYVWGAPWSIARRLGTIEYHHDAGSGFRLVHRYTLSYRTSMPGGSQRSQLASVQQCGPTDCLAPTTFQWQDGVAGLSTEAPAPAADYGNAVFGDFDGDGDTDLYVPVGGYWSITSGSAYANGTGTLSGSTSSGQRVFGFGLPLDFNGDGRIDLLTRGAGANWVVLQSTGIIGSGAFTVIDTGISVNTMPLPSAVDLDGDGRHDLVYVVPASGVYLVRNTGGAFAAPQLSSIRTSSGWAFSAPQDGLLKIADFDGDGREDLLVATGPAGQWNWAAFLSVGSDFDPGPLGYYLNTTSASPEDVIVLDVNGDGLSDLLFYSHAAWSVRISRGTNALVAGLPGPPAFVAPNCLEQISVSSSAKTIAVDVNGDGRADILRANGSGWRVHLSDGRCYSNSQGLIDLAGTAPANVTRVAPVDLNGDGYADLLFTQPGNTGVIRNHIGGKTDLVVQFTDGLGNSTQASYRALSGWSGYSATAAASPGERVLRGGPLYVVSQYVASTGLVAPAPAAYMTTLSYADAKIDTRGRGFLGFAKLRATDSRNGLVTETSYLQSFPLTGRVDLQTVWNGTHRVSVYDPDWQAHTDPAGSGDAAGDYHFVYLAQEIREDYETDADGLYDFGLVRRATHAFSQWNFNHGVATSEQTTIESPQSPGASYVTTRNVTLNDQMRIARWCLGQPDRIDTTRSISGAMQTRSVQYGYMIGTCRIQRQVEGSATDPAEQLVTTFSYDPYGRLLSASRAPADLSLPARQTNYAYDAEGYRVGSESQLIDGESPHVTVHGWDNASGMETSRTDVQGRTTRWFFDAYNRAIAEVRPVGAAVTTYSACGACFPSAAKYRIRTTDVNGYWAETYHDAMGRVVGRGSMLVDYSESRQLIEYDSFGRVARESTPFLAGSATYWTSYTYDLNGRIKSENRPVSESSPAGAVTSYVYSGSRTDMRDSERRTTIYTHDPEGRLLSVTAPLQGSAAYNYTPFGELDTVYDAGLNITTMAYNDRGLRIEIASPDSGLRQLRYNAFGEQVSQRDGKNPATVTTYAYDQLGRLRQRTEPEGTQTWNYDPASGPGKGLLQSTTGPTDLSATGFQESHVYDTLGRARQVSTTIDGARYTTDYAYNELGQLTSMTYPAVVGGTRPTFAYGYTNGFLHTVSQVVPGLGSVALYEVISQDALGRESRVRFGGGALDEQDQYDAANTRLRAIRSGPALGTSVQNYSYAWDTVGNLLSRQDGNRAVTETFSYDNLDRLSSASRNGQQTLSVNYSPDGNIQSRSDVGSYSYAPGSSPAHAVTGISGGPRGTQAFAYDANGNMTSRAGAAINWTSFNLPRQINASGANCSADCVSFTYGPDRRRVKQVRKLNGATTVVYYVAPYFEVEVDGGKTTYRSHAFANGEVVYTQAETSDWNWEGYYVLRDHEHSVDRLVRAVGGNADQIALSFDAWGKRRNADWSADPADLRYADRPWSARGYTGHEHLDGEKLIHMNGRIEDPVTGRMLSPDPVLGSISNPQTFNPYSYAGNNPTSFTDPSGFFLGRIGSFLHRLAKHSIGISFGHRIVKKYGREIVAIVAAYYTAGASAAWLGAADAAAASATGAVAAEGAAAATLSAEATVIGWAAGGAVAGAISTGTLKGALFGAVTGAAFGGVDVAFGSQYSLGRVLTDGTVGGLSSSIQGGNFGDGFKLAGSLSALTYAATSMRNAMVEQSKIDPRNASGTSDGFRGDHFKLGGCRAPCTSSLLGGVQGRAGYLFGRAYAPGSFLDHLIETYAGPHDFFNAPLFYNSVGNNIMRTGLLSSILEPVSFANVAVATPFAAVSVIPPYAYPVHD